MLSFLGYILYNKKNNEAEQLEIQETGFTRRTKSKDIQDDQSSINQSTSSLDNEGSVCSSKDTKSYNSHNSRSNTPLYVRATFPKQQQQQQALQRSSSMKGTYYTNGFSTPSNRNPLLIRTQNSYIDEADNSSKHFSSSSDNDFSSSSDNEGSKQPHYQAGLPLLKSNIPNRETSMPPTASDLESSYQSQQLLQARQRKFRKTTPPSTNKNLSLKKQEAISNKHTPSKTLQAITEEDTPVNSMTTLPPEASDSSDHQEKQHTHKSPKHKRKKHRRKKEPSSGQNKEKETTDITVNSPRLSLDSRVEQYIEKEIAKREKQQPTVNNYTTHNIYIANNSTTTNNPPELYQRQLETLALPTPFQPHNTQSPFSIQPTISRHLSITACPASSSTSVSSSSADPSSEYSDESNSNSPASSGIGSGDENAPSQRNRESKAEASSDDEFMIQTMSSIEEKTIDLSHTKQRKSLGTKKYNTLPKTQSPTTSIFPRQLSSSEPNIPQMVATASEMPNTLLKNCTCSLKDILIPEKQGLIKTLASGLSRKKVQPQEIKLCSMHAMPAFFKLDKDYKARLASDEKKHHCLLDSLNGSLGFSKLTTINNLKVKYELNEDIVKCEKHCFLKDVITPCCINKPCVYNKNKSPDTILHIEGEECYLF